MQTFVEDFLQYLRHERRRAGCRREIILRFTKSRGCPFPPKIRRVNHIHAFHGEVNARTRFAVFADRADEILNLLRETAKPVFIATRTVPARLRLQFFREIFAGKAAASGA